MPAPSEGSRSEGSRQLLDSRTPLLIRQWMTATAAQQQEPLTCGVQVVKTMGGDENGGTCRAPSLQGTGEPIRPRRIEALPRLVQQNQIGVFSRQHQPEAEQLPVA